FADVLVKLIGVGYFALNLDLCEALGDFSIHVDVQIFAMLDQEQGVDLVAQTVSSLLFDHLLQFGSADPFLAKLRLQFLPRSFELTPGDDVAIDFGRNLLDHPDIRRQTNTYKREKSCAQPKVHMKILSRKLGENVSVTHMPWRDGEATGARCQVLGARDRSNTSEP